jgi:glycerol-3-phosphate dehydrogenase (NAD(P)+)
VGGGTGSFDRVAVVGAGSWGTTVAALLAEPSGGTDVRLWARNRDLADSITADHENRAYLPGIALPGALRATGDIASAVAGADAVIVAVPSYAFRAVLSSGAEHLVPGVPVVSLSKGLEPVSLARMTEVIAETAPGHPAAVLTGPNLALEVAQGQPAASVIACGDPDPAAALQELFSRGSLRVYTNRDVIGCEIAGVGKNVIAIAAGMARGMGFGDNTRATLITRGLAEISRLAVAMGGEAATMSGLAGMGDMIATCASTQSRNNTVGARLGSGETLEEVMASMNMVAEGVRSSLAVLELAARHGVEMPITEQVAAVCHRGVTVADALRALMSRTSTSEFG